MEADKNPIAKIILEIIQLADVVIKKYIDEELVLDYVDIFPKSEEERLNLLEEINKLGKQISSTKTGPIYLLDEPIQTKYGNLKLVRVRIYDNQKTQRGAPDFKVKDYAKFKEKYLGKDFFNLIERKEYEMLELDIKNSNVLIYFPSETLAESLGLKS